ncbi:MAG TPA: Do family serine endopeptidase [Candidatus Angelobacter sp.]|nr:Do family serine endopeptidase [Candidatus Angelobacter sp.]
MSNEVYQVRRWVGASIIIVALIAGAFLGTWAVRWAGQKVLGAPMVPVKVAGAVDPVRLGAFANGFASVVQPALPAVVNISTTRVVKTQQNMPGFFNDPFFQQFFGNQFGGPSRPQTEKEHSLGSGVIINSDGYILTNNHVVEHGSDIQVQWNNKNYPGKVVGTDPQTDIAVVKINATGLPTLTFGDSSKLRVGDVVFAIGDPFGIGETATMGIVSATGRSLGIEGPRAYEDFIQTDAAINPGNSGGAMIDLHGNLVGINTAILTSGGQEEGGNEGIGFAVPIDMARSVMEQIIQHGKVERGHIGVSLTPLTPDMAKEFGYNGGGEGALIDSVSPGSPAEKAGIKRGDIILGLNGGSVTGAGDLTAQIANMPPGTAIRLKVFRDGKTFDVAVTLAPGSAYAGQPSESQAGNDGGESPDNGGKAMEGVHVQNLTPDIAQQLNLPMGTKGVVVDNVEQGSGAAEAGLQRGDLIIEVNRKTVNNMTDFRAAMAGTGSQPVLLLVRPRAQSNVTEYILVEPQQ